MVLFTRSPTARLRCCRELCYDVTSEYDNVSISMVCTPDTPCYEPGSKYEITYKSGCHWRSVLEDIMRGIGEYRKTCAESFRDEESGLQVPP